MICLDCHSDVRRLAGRGLCNSCYAGHRRAGDLWRWGRVHQPVVVTVEEWEHLADPTRPVREEARRLAHRLGLTPERLENIVYAEVGSRFEGGHGERYRGPRLTE